MTNPRKRQNPKRSRMSSPQRTRCVAEVNPGTMSRNFRSLGKICNLPIYRPPVDPQLRGSAMRKALTAVAVTVEPGASGRRGGRPAGGGHRTRHRHGRSGRGDRRRARGRCERGGEPAPAGSHGTDWRAIGAGGDGGWSRFAHARLRWACRLSVVATGRIPEFELVLVNLRSRARQRDCQRHEGRR